MSDKNEDDKPADRSEKCSRCRNVGHTVNVYVVHITGMYMPICQDCLDRMPAVRLMYVSPRHSLRGAVVDSSWKNAKNKPTEPGKLCECGNLKKPHLSCCKKCREAARTHHATLPREATEYEKGFSTGQMDHSAGCRLDSMWNRNPYEPMIDYVRGYRDGWDSIVWLDTVR